MIAVCLPSVSLLQKHKKATFANVSLASKKTVMNVEKQTSVKKVIIVRRMLNAKIFLVTLNVCVLSHELVMVDFVILKLNEIHVLTATRMLHAYRIRIQIFVFVIMVLLAMAMIVNKKNIIQIINQLRQLPDKQHQQPVSLKL